MNIQRSLRRAAPALGAGLALALCPASPGATVTSTGDAGAGTLRAALASGDASIDFNIPGAEPHTITLTSGPLVTTVTVTIDGFTQEGASANTNPITMPVNAVHTVIIDGGGNDVFHIMDDDCIVRGLRIHSGDRGITIMSGATDNRIEGCEIFACTEAAVEIDDTNDNFVGTNGDGTNDDAERNVLRDCDHGVRILNSGAIRNVVAGNFIGVEADGTTDDGNFNGGVTITNDAGPDNRVGTDGDGLADLAERNVLSATSSGAGVEISDNASRNVVAGNLIGTDRTGTQALLNSEAGVIISSGASDNLIGTDGDGIADVAERNVISGNEEEGVEIIDPGTNDNIVAGNYIGVDITGQAALPNDGGGVLVEDGPANNIIGTDGDGSPGDAGEGNVISGNFGAGVEGDDAGTGNIVAGNLIGTNAAGTAPVPNVNDGVELFRSNLWRIGTDGNGTSDLVEGNVISGNGNAGIALNQSNDSRIAGNLIGTNPAGDELGNDDDGIEIRLGFRTYIGPSVSDPEDPVRRNVIAFNGEAGISIVETAQLLSLENNISSNSIHSNGDLGIDLGKDGVTLNDPGDGDAGPNRFQNFPVLTSATDNNVQGTINSVPNRTIFIEIFASSAADPSGFGEGEVFLARETVTTNGAGNANFVIPLVIPPDKRVLTSTATWRGFSPGGAPETSEFSAAILAPLTCDAPGRPATDGTNDRVLRGYIVGWAVDTQAREIRWNHLKGEGTIVDYRGDAAWEYATYNYAHVDPAIDHGALSTTPGTLHLDGLEYAESFDELLLNFQASGSTAWSYDDGHAMYMVESETDLTLFPVSADLRQNNDGPVTTKASFLIWNENEIKFSNTHRCITCWDQQLVSRYDTINSFLRTFLQTDHGKARIDGHAANICNVLDDPDTPEDESVTSIEAPLLGVAARELCRSGQSGSLSAAGSNLWGVGSDATATIRHDLQGIPGEANGPDEPAAGSPQARADRGQTLDLGRGGARDADPPAALSGPGTGLRASTSTKGSLVIFPKVELRWDAGGNLVQDTILSLTNDYPASVRVKLYFINGDPPLIEDPDGAACFHPGWNWVDIGFVLTGNEPTYWSARTGLPKGVVPFTVLDP